MNFTEALSAIFNGDKPPKRYMRVEAIPEQNELTDKRWFVRFRIWQDDGYGPEVKHYFAIDEGSGYAMAEALIKVLAEIKERR